MAITVSDTFTRANTSNGTLGSTETGLTLAWQNATNWRINTNTATNDSTSLSPSWVLVSQPSVTASILTGSKNGPGVAFWVKDSLNYWVAYMYSNRYLDSVTTNCETGGCTQTSCSCPGACTTNAINYNRSTTTGTGNSGSIGTCVGCSVGSCGTPPTCTSAGSFNYGTYRSACGGSCTSRTVDNQACATTNTCGSFSSSNTCVNSCTASSSVKKCGTRSCGEIGTTCVTASGCGYNTGTNRNCTGTCTKVGGNVNAALTCAANTCPPCPEGSTNNYRQEYYFRVARVVAGSATNIVNTLYSDTTSTSISVAAIKVITTSGSYRAIGYTDTGMTTIGVDTTTLASAQTDYLNSVGHGMIRMDMGTSSPNIGYAVDNFAVEYEPLGGDSVGIIQG